MPVSAPLQRFFRILAVTRTVRSSRMRYSVEYNWRVRAFVCICTNRIYHERPSMWPKYLVWFAALLSPVQASQGMHVLCNLPGSCVQANTTCRHRVRYQAVYPFSQPTPEAFAQADTYGDRDVFRVAFPCTCPPKCECRRSASVQSRPAEQPRLSGASDPILSPYGRVSNKHNLTQRGNMDSQREAAPASAQQTCASLCRFLA